MTYQEWERKYPQAAQDLRVILRADAHYAPEKLQGKSEAWAQQQDRFAVSAAGGFAWRNNVGATPSKIFSHCPRCHFDFETKQTPVRYGLANDSHEMNQIIKSSDLIGVIPRKITFSMVGTTIGQFLALEEKRPGWTYSDEVEQLKFLQLCASVGAHAQFSTGNFKL